MQQTGMVQDLGWLDQIGDPIGIVQKIEFLLNYQMVYVHTRLHLRELDP